MYKLSQKPKILKKKKGPTGSKLRSYLASYAKRIQLTREKLEITQDRLAADPLNKALINEEMKLVHDLHQWSLVKENMLKQKSRTTWTKCDDVNYKYFNSQCKIIVRKQHFLYL